MTQCRNPAASIKNACLILATCHTHPHQEVLARWCDDHGRVERHVSAVVQIKTMHAGRGGGTSHSFQVSMVLWVHVQQAVEAVQSLH
jgi:hypothetical protein